MFPGTEGEDDDCRSLYSLSDRKFYRVRFPQIPGHLCVGSGAGWMATVDPSDLELQLLHLPGGSVTRLPSITTFSYVDAGEFDHRGRLTGYMIRRELRLFPRDSTQYSSNPSPNFYFTPLHAMNSFYKKVVFFPSASLVFTIHSDPHCLAFCRVGDESWTEFDMGCTCIADVSSGLGPRRDGEKEFSDGWFRDVTCYGGQFYATVTSGWVLALDLTSTPPRCKCLALRPPPLICSRSGEEEDPLTSYLVESPDGAELMMVFRYADSETNFFTVFKCNKLISGNHNQEEAEWLPVKCLGDLVLFVGANLSLAVYASNFPELIPNSIYFTQATTPQLKQDFPSDMGVFNMESGTAEPLPLPVGNSVFMRRTWPLPVWIPHASWVPLVTQLDEVDKRRKANHDHKKSRLRCRLKSSLRKGKPITMTRKADWLNSSLGEGTQV